MTVVKTRLILQQTSCMCALFSKSKYFRHQSERNTQESRYRRQRNRKMAISACSAMLFCQKYHFRKVKKKQLQTYPRTQQLCATNVRTEVDPSNNKNPCGCKVLKCFFGGVTLNILRSQTEDHFFLRMTLTALFVRLIINLRISIFKGKILINPGPEWCDNRFTAQPSERTKLLRPAHTPSIVQLYFAIYAYLRQNKNFLNFY